MERGADEDDAPAGRGIGPGVGVPRRGLDEFGHGRFERVEGADRVDVDDGLERIWREAFYGRYKVTCRSSSAQFPIQQSRQRFLQFIGMDVTYMT